MKRRGFINLHNLYPEEMYLTLTQSSKLSNTSECAAARRANEALLSVFFSSPSVFKRRMNLSLDLWQ